MSTFFDRISCRDYTGDEDHLDRERHAARRNRATIVAQHERLISIMDARDGLSGEDRFCLLLALVQCYVKIPLPGMERS
jgi:hypothetical protein